MGQRVALAVLAATIAVWAVTAFVSLFTRDYAALTIETPVVLVMVGAAAAVLTRGSRP